MKRSESIAKTTLVTVDHKGENGVIQSFASVNITRDRNDSLTFHGAFGTEWVTLVDGKPFVCRTEEGECLVEYHAEYEGETFPLAPFTSQEICANQRDLEITVQMAREALEVLGNYLRQDFSHIKINNVA